MRKGRVKVIVNRTGPRLVTGQDVAVAVEIGGEMVGLRCSNLVLRVENRKAVATLELVVDEVEIAGVLLHSIEAESLIDVDTSRPSPEAPEWTKR